MRLAGEVVQFKTGATVALLESPNGNDTWRVIYLRGTDELPQGLITYTNEDILSRGDVVDWSAVDDALDHLHEIYHTAERLVEADAIAETGVS